MIISHRIRYLILTSLLIIAADCAAIRDRDLWILVDTRTMVLSVMEGNKVRRSYKEIAIGRAGTTLDKRAGDHKTPLGDYRLVRITSNSAFHRFFGLDYPTLAQAERALKAGRIGRDHYDAIHKAFKIKTIPPQTTPLGGYIGIHGIGAGDPATHEQFNWTQGCVALTNRHHRWTNTNTLICSIAKSIVSAPKLSKNSPMSTVIRSVKP